MSARGTNDRATTWIRWLPIRWAIGGLLASLAWSILSTWHGGFQEMAGGPLAGIYRLLSFIVLPICVLGFSWGWVEKVHLNRALAADLLKDAAKSSLSRNARNAIICGVVFCLYVHFLTPLDEFQPWTTGDSVTANVATILGWSIPWIPVGLLVGFVSRRSLLHRLETSPQTVQSQKPAALLGPSLWAEAAALIAILAALGMTRSMVEEPRQTEKVADMQTQVAKKMRMDLPMRVDEVTTLLSVMAVDRRLKFFYRLDVSKDELRAGWEEQQASTLRYNACLQPSGRKLMESGAEYNSLYLDKNGLLIADILVQASDCATAAAASEYDKTQDMCSIVARDPSELSRLSDSQLQNLYCQIVVVLTDANERIKALESQEHEDPASVRDEKNEMIGVNNICLIASLDADREMRARKLSVDPDKCRSN